MSETVSFEIQGQPVPKGRPRFRVVAGRFAQTYTDAKTAGAEKTIALASKAAMGARRPFEGPLVVLLEFHLQIPASWSARKRSEAATGAIPHIGRPDTDNLAKLALDGANGVLWGDDSQIVELSVRKFYSEQPKTRISVKPA